MNRFLPLTILLMFGALLQANTPQTNLNNFMESAFTPNMGQVVDQNGEPVNDVLAKASIPGLDLYLTKTGVTYVMEQYEDDLAAKPHPVYINERKYKISFSRVDVELVGAQLSAAQMAFSGAESWQSNYYYGSKGTGQMNVSHYQSVTIVNVYPGIDWIWKFNKDGKLEYDFVAHAGSNAGLIKMKYHYADLKVDNNSLVFAAKNGSITEGPLQASVNGTALDIKYAYNADTKEVTFSTARYDRNSDLIIDPPLTLNWSSQFGGTFHNGLRGVATDNSGYVYSVGYTTSLNFPTFRLGTVAYWDSSYNGQSDAILLKIDSNQVLQWATFMGGSGNDYANSVYADNDGRLYVTGGAQTGFPLQNVIGGFYQSGANGTDAFIAEFNPNLSLYWSTFYGGNGTEEGLKIYHDANVNRNALYVAGYTSSTSGTFPTLNNGGYYQTAVNGIEAFILRFNTTFTTRTWATVYGGSGDEYATSLAVDSLGKVVMTGFTTSTNFPVAQGAGYYQANNAGNTDGFIVQFDASSARNSATYYGGRSSDYFTDVTCGATGSFIFTGRTRSTNFPIDSLGGFAFNQTHIADSLTDDAFIVKCGNNMVLKWSTYYGGKSTDVGTGVTTDSRGRIYVTGFTASTDFPVDSFPGAFYQGTNHGNIDGFVALFSNQGDRYWSTYKGDTCFEYPSDIAYDTRFNKFYIVGEGLVSCLRSNPGNGGQSLPDTGQVNSGGGSSVGFCWAFNGLAAPICDNFRIGLATSIDDCSGQCNGIASITINNGTSPYQIVWTGHQLNTTYDSTLCEGENNVEVHDAHGCKDEVTFVLQPLTASVTAGGFSCAGTIIYATDDGGNTYGPGIRYQWSNRTGFRPDTTTADPGGQVYISVTVSDGRGCTAVASVYPPQQNSLADYIPEISLYPNCYNSDGTMYLYSPSGLAGMNDNITWTQNGYILGTGYFAYIPPSDQYYGQIVVTDSDYCYFGQPVSFYLFIPMGLNNFYLNFNSPTGCHDYDSLGTVTLQYIYPTYNSNLNPYWTTLNVDNDPTNTYTYSWSGGSITGTYSNSINISAAPGYFDLTVTDYWGCSVEYPGYIPDDREYPNPTWLATQPACVGDNNGAITQNNSGSLDLPYTYQWSNNSTSTNLTNLNANTYGVTTTGSNGCTSTASYILTYNHSDRVEAHAINGGSCSSGSIEAHPTNTSAGQTIYRWSTGQRDTFAVFRNDTLRNLAAGTYSVTVTHAGRTDTICIEVTNGVGGLTAHIQSSTYNCNTGNHAQAVLGGGTNPITQVWSTGDTSLIIGGPRNGQIWLRATDHNGCVATDTQVVHLANPFAATHANGIIKCNGDSASETFNATGGFTPYTGTGTYHYPAGTFVHVVSDSSGCTVHDTLVIVQPSPINVTATVLDTFSCLLTTVHVQVSATGGTPPYNGTGSRTYTTAGITPINVTDNNGCLASVPVNIAIKPDSVFSVTVIDSVCSAGQITLAAAGLASYTWYPAGVTDSLYTVGQINADTTVFVSGTAANSCTTVDTFHLVLKSCVTTQSFAPQALELNLYPNPTTDICYLQLNRPASNNGQIELFTTEGKLVSINPIKQGEQLKQIDCSKLACAMYVIHARLEGQDVYFKLVVDR